ncbi:arsenical pump-driving ATPase [Prosthecobacter sp.]|uniref:arsenical pump-driving ATPase n=1 Tax=Prosthecobacter sp. TaxID=1965333 RepID=UPI001DF1ABBD|nr:arsenical pump-driving ATPase [Prosthecobacter sp.]MCB1277219.1 arsenical pump-driving ATPase [Prosthecobacter sp.]
MKLPLFRPDAATSTRYLFFTGKGGVGKTSLSCATALKLAEAGKRVLLVSTDPASNLDEVLMTTLTNQPTPVPEVPGLHALNINPVEAAAAYRERVIGPMRGVLPEAALRSMEEQLSGSCTVEIAAFDEFSGFIGNPDAARDFDHVIFDTAPTGHTLRLMSLAKAWDQFLDNNTSGTSCLGPLAGLEKQRGIYEATVQTLSDASATTLVLVSRPQLSALREAERTSGELRALGVTNQCLVINGTFETNCPQDVTAQAMQQRGESAMGSASVFIDSMPSFIMPLRPINILGIEGLRVLLDGESAKGSVAPVDAEWIPPDMRRLTDLVDEIEKNEHGVIMTMGKGGVGKTTVAAAIAVLLARRGHAVHLSTTDPAAHIAQTLDGQIDGLTVRRIDPAAETAAYQQEVMQTQGAQMDESGRALLEEDLRSPCTEEIAVFRAFAREVGQGTRRFVVLDTAPTGHTLLLLDASEAYHRELQRQARSTQPEEVLHLLDRLRDPDFTHILLVTLPEATPVHEAAALQADLRRAHIDPHAWVINQSLLGCGSCDLLLRRREETEHRYIREVVEKQAKRTAWLPWQAVEPVGGEALSRLAQSGVPRMTVA